MLQCTVLGPKLVEKLAPNTGAGVEFPAFSWSHLICMLNK